VPPIRRNRLADEPSLYLRQHSTNPVDWYPWCEEALSRSRNANLPILLSIGYSACHWCHVMERECFENEAIAALMSELFVCIKVDREERPDIDAVYMKAVQAMTGRGGWPMTVFLTPDLLPFYAGTFFPPVDRAGTPGFPRVLRAVAATYRSSPDRIQEIGARIVDAMTSPQGKESVEIDGAALVKAGDALARSMDAEFGGFGNAPKFPGAAPLGFQIDLQAVSPAEERRQLIQKALDAMAAGGIYDHLGGGFHRYSVDRSWRVPHFEKMLYDQAAMVDLYRTAWLAFRQERYRDVALGTLEFVRREMKSTGGAFFAAQDADSDGREGGFFRWSAEEIRAALCLEEAEIALEHFGLNRVDDETGHVLRVAAPIDVIAQNRGIPCADVTMIINRAKATLLAHRASRVPPATDQKILADWNGLMIAAMALSGRLFRKAELVQCAADAADHVLSLLWRDERLFHFHAEGVTRVAGFLDDHAFLGRALLEVYAATARAEYAVVARQMADILLRNFQDDRDGGFYFTARDGDTILRRERRLQDGAVPAGNSVAADFLSRLHVLTGDERYRSAADRAIGVAASLAVGRPYYGASLLHAALRRALGYTTVVIFAPRGSTELLETALDVHAPGLMVLSPGSSPDVGRLPIERAYGRAASGAAGAYVCRGGTCSLPLFTSAGLRDRLLEVVACEA
jgi:uncharacterized protein YyaL (SSP411 family)